MAAMAALAAVAQRRVRQTLLPSRFLVAAGIGVVFVALGYVTSRWPVIALAVAVAGIFVLVPRICRVLLIALAAVGPTFNPPLLGIGAGRLYLVQGLIVGIVAGSVAFAARSGMFRPASALVILTALLVAAETVGRPSAGVAWVYRPLQVFFVAFAVRTLFRARSARRLVLALAWGSLTGCALASLHAVLPSFDPFVVSRPKDLPFVSAIGSYARATGAFTYPNNLGTFAAYTVLFGASAWLLNRPRLPRMLSIGLMASGASGLTLAGSRAAGLGLLCGLLYLTSKAAPKRRALILAAEAMFGLLVIAVVLSSPTAVEVVDQRLQSATGESFFGRLDSVGESFQQFLASPLIGTGSSESNLDNFVVLYGTQAGVVGAVLLIAIARTTLRSAAPKQYPELRVALLIALTTSGMLQDSLGQTLVTWFLGALLGVAMLQPPEDAQLAALPDPSDGHHRVATTR